MHAFNKGVLIVAPPTLHRQGLLTTLRDSWPTWGVTLETDAAVLPKLLYRQSYAVVVLDCASFTESPPDFLERLCAIRSTQPIVLLTGPRLGPDVRHYLARHSATHIWLPRHAAPATVATLFQAYASDSMATAGSLTASPHRLLPPTPFSRRELEVLRLVVKDYCNQEIADHLCLSVRTVESHRRALLQKAGAKTLIGLAMQAVREGWVAI